MRRRTLPAVLLLTSALGPFAGGCFFNTDFCKDNNCGTGGGAGTASTGSGSSTSTGVPTECTLKEGQAIPATCGVFVKAGATGKGTQGDPVGDVQAAVQAAGVTPRIYVCGGDTFSGAVSLASGISVFGGFDCATWTFSSGAAHPLIDGPPGKVALSVTAGTATTFIEAIDVRASSTKSGGQSSIAIFADGATLSLKSVALTAGDAADGGPGMDGGVQAAAAPGGGMGGGAGSAVPDGGMPSQVNTCVDGTSSGGKGGTGGTSPLGSGGNGDAGDTGLGGMPGAGEFTVGWNCAVGGTNGGVNPGDNGSDMPAGNGASASEIGAITSTEFTNAPGHDGMPGTRGKGGGGGGGSKASAATTGAGGGGGGAGGCGGKQGTGGAGGGSSIGVVAHGGSLTLADVTISLGHAGKGGKGGNGQLGQPGGAKGTGGATGGGAKAGCDGGLGGSGGNGGSGGGGRGGHAIGILYSGSAPQGTPMILTPGIAGAGGSGGSNGVDQATAGQDGIVATTQSVP